MQAPGRLNEFLDHVIFEFALFKPLIPTYSHLLLSALFPIYIGAHASLSRPSSAADSKRRKRGDNISDTEDDSEEEDQVQKMEGLGPSDAVMLPIMAGLTLGGLYLVIQWLKDPALLNKLLSWYFSQAGIIFAVAFVKDGSSILRSFIFPSRYSHNGVLWKVNQEKRSFVAVGGSTDAHRALERPSPLPGVLGSVALPGRFSTGLWQIRELLYRKATIRAYIRAVLEITTRFTILDVISAIIAMLIVGYFTLVDKPWWLTNFLGFSFSYGALQFMSPTTFWTGSLILSSLFFYDIYFVFFTPLMVTVAKSLDIPIKLLFPRPPAQGDDPDLGTLAMLGLGDIIIPGMMIGLALRFDLFLYYKLKGALVAGENLGGASKAAYVNATGAWGERFWVTRVPSLRLPDAELLFHDAKSFPKTYFHAGLVGYAIGMIATLLAMQLSSHAQPALLYLVPGVLGSLWTTAYLNGDIQSMWNFSDAVEEGEEEEAKGDSKTEKRTENPLQSISHRIFFRKAKTEQSKNNKASGDTTKENQNRNASSVVKIDGGIDLLEEDPTVKQRRNDERSSVQDGNSKGRERDSFDIISFSISLPPRSRRHQSKPQPTEPPVDETVLPQENSTGSSSTSSSPILVGRDGEPPLKRRKRAGDPGKEFPG